MTDYSVNEETVHHGAFGPRVSVYGSSPLVLRGKNVIVPSLVNPGVAGSRVCDSVTCGLYYVYPVPTHSPSRLKGVYD